MIDALEALRLKLHGRPTDLEAAHWAAVADEAQQFLEALQASGDAYLANRAWHLLYVAKGRESMCEIFQQLRTGKFRAAWPRLEELEKMVGALNLNGILEDEFAIVELGQMVERWQSLYPYTVFASPEMLIRKQTCSICDAVVTPLESCGHLPGRVYAGELCSRHLIDTIVLSVSLVRDPVQKYSVLIPAEDPHDYTKLRFVAARASGPFSRWRVETVTTFHDHELFAEWPPEGDCPCHSGRTYEACCAAMPGVRFPHDNVFFDNPLPDGLSAVELRRRRFPNGPMENVSVAPQV